MRLTLWRGLPWLLTALLVCALPAAAQTQQENRLRRIDIVPRQGFSRVKLFFHSPPDYSVTVLPGRIRVRISGADSPSFRKFRSYSDPQLTGLFCSVRNGMVDVLIPVREREPGVQAVSPAEPTVLALEIGPALKRVQPSPDLAPGREQILKGIEKFVREFQIPGRTGLPFAPTDAKLLKGLLPEEEVKLFQRGEDRLYHEQGSEALEIFGSFQAKAPAVRALAWYRQGEALALLDRNDEALAAFRQGEAIWPAYLEHAPALLLAYGEVRAKSGDFAGGRAVVVRLIERFSGTVYAAPLLERLALMWERHGETEVALSMYRTLADHAPGTAAATRGRLKLADREMFSLSRDLYRSLLVRYLSVYHAPGDFLVRDEALFKMALLHALYGPPREALKATVGYDTCYPRGIFSGVVKKMREELLLPVCRELHAAGDKEGLARTAFENHEYLAVCFTDRAFAPCMADAFRGAGMLTRELELFQYLSGRSWAAEAAPFLAARTVEDALTLGNLTLAETAARGFLARFPEDPLAPRVREELGRIAFEKGDLKGVTAELSFLAKGNKPQFAESDYYLGKALAAAGDQRGAEKSLSRFTSGASPASPLLSDGYFAVAGARVALKEYGAALAAYRAGAKTASGETADQFLYKMGELYLQLKMVRQARDAWEQVVRRGGSDTWAKLSAEALKDLNWRLKIARELP